jgi:hypothetical protein
MATTIRKNNRTGRRVMTSLDDLRVEPRRERALLTEYLKLICKNGETPQRYGCWDMPVQLADGSWQPGEWQDVSRTPAGLKRKLKPCTAGAIHFVTAEQALDWHGGLLWWVEADGEVIDHGDKTICQRVRVLRPALSTTAGYLWAIDCARHISDTWQVNADLLDTCLNVMTAEALYGDEWADAAATAVTSARAAKAAWDARGARAAWGARAVRDARAAKAAWDARAARGARAAKAAWDARAAGAAWGARAVKAVWDARAVWDERAWQVERLQAYLHQETEWGDV